MGLSDCGCDSCHTDTLDQLPIGAPLISSITKLNTGLCFNILDAVNVIR